MKRVIVIVLLFAFATQIGGYYLHFLGVRHQLKMSMKESIRSGYPCEKVLRLSFDAPEYKKIQWEENNEFTYQGNLYDVVSINTQQGITIIDCIGDKDETQLLVNFQESQKKRQNEAPSKNQKLPTVITLFPPLATSFDILPMLQTPIHHAKYEAFCSIFSLDILSPPPLQQA